MSDRPSYFESVREGAAKRWVQLEGDPDLAGPWHQLFKQVQSPRHVVSELLQNADDAGATKATVDVLDGEFVFTHDGEDFSAEHFKSLCRFGYSNKRSLHTIGFRGIGFKSTFSLGDEVRLLTPTLAAKFHRDRFTEPVWLDSCRHPDCTEVRVTIKDDHRLRDLQRNLEEWLKSPSALLFFRSIRCLRIGETEVRWVSHGHGPVPESEWVALHSEPEQKHLLVRSSEEGFPADAIEEIRQERMGSLDESMSFPPCPVEIVLGLEGRLFVILPTGVTTALPFACNAPFIQDPARVKIKEPEISPTNRWLLKRAGELAANAMMAWVGAADGTAKERCRAYDLLPDVDRDDSSLEGTCGMIVEEAFEARMEEQLFLLSHDEELLPSQGCVHAPNALTDIWPSATVSELFDAKKRPLLSRHISRENRNKLSKWQFIDTVSNNGVLGVLETKSVPRPDSWDQLLTLWSYVQSIVGYDYSGRRRKILRLVPVEGMTELRAPSETVHLARRRGVNNEEDWQFLAKLVQVCDRSWLQVLVAAAKNEEPDRRAQAANQLLADVSLGNASPIDRVVAQACDALFGREEVDTADYVRMAHILASLGPRTPNGFQFVTRDGHRTAVEHGIVADPDGQLEDLTPAEWYEDHCLADEYSRSSADRSRWEAWLASAKSGVWPFARIESDSRRIRARYQVLQMFRERQVEPPSSYPYQRDNFKLEDCDFDEALVAFWEELSDANPSIWERVLRRILQSPVWYWNGRTEATLKQSGTVYEKPVHSEPIPAKWIVRFQSIQCLPDTHGVARQPSELLLRTPSTEALMDVEPFVEAEIDTEATKPLLRLLGVRDTPAGLDKLLDRIRALATLPEPLPQLQEIAKWYRAMDRVLGRCATKDQNDARAAFSKERLVLTEDGEWVTSAEAFQESDEQGLPDVPVIHSSVAHLSLWSRIGVADRPSAELIIAWLSDHDSETKLDAPTARRVLAALKRYPMPIWEECGHWITLDRTWVPVEQLDFRLTMRGLTKWSDLFPAIKQRTADFQMLSADACDQSPFSTLADLGASIEFRLTEKQHDLPKAEKRPWLLALGQGLSRTSFADEDQQAAVCEAGRRLAQTVWQPFQIIRVTPYIDGTPAGQPHSPDVLWHDTTLFVRNGKLAKIFDRVASELARPFANAKIADAIKACIERKAEFVDEYLEKIFELAASPLVDTSGSGREAPASDVSSPVGQDSPEADHGSSDSSVDGGENDPASRPVADGPTGDQPDDGQESSDDLEPSGQGPERQERHRQPRTEPSLIQRFAKAKGYQWNENAKRYTHKDGTWIERSEPPFNWQRIAQTGKLLRWYWAVEQCLSGGGIEITAELWELIRKYPDSTALITLGEDGRPLEISGDTLIRMQEGGSITLFPAKYRIRKSSEVCA